MNRSLGLLARIAILTLALVASREILHRGLLIAQTEASLPDALAREAATARAQMAFLAATALSAVVLRSSAHGLRLLGVLFSLHFGLGTVLPLLEPLAFPAYLPTRSPGGWGLLLVSGAATSLLISALAALVFGRFRPTSAALAGALSSRHWPARLAGGAVAFVASTLLAAYLAQSREPMAAFFHRLAGQDSFGAWLATALALYPLLPAAQALRALVLAGALLPLVATDRGPRHLTAALAGAVTSVLVGSPLAVPSPALAESVRVSHLAEVIWSMLPLGILFAELALAGQAPPRPPAIVGPAEERPILGLSSEEDPA